MRGHDYRLLRPRITIGVNVGASIAFVAGAIATGVIGNRADSLFIWVWGVLSTYIDTNISFEIVMVLIAVTSLFLLHYIRATNSAFDIVDHIMRVNNSLLRLLPELVSVTGKEFKVENILVGLLRDATETFAGQVHRATILLPDKNGEFLLPWASYQMPDTNIKRMQFYIGKELYRKRGLAGEAFVQNRILIGHMTKRPRYQPACDNPEYIKFDEKRPFPPYRSFVCVPVLVMTAKAAEKENCIGVVCFDSSESTTVFDTPGVQELLKLYSKCIGAIIQMYLQSLILSTPDLSSTPTQGNCHTTTPLSPDTSPLSNTEIGQLEAVRSQFTAMFSLQ